MWRVAHSVVILQIQWLFVYKLIKAAKQSYLPEFWCEMISCRTLINLFDMIYCMQLNRVIISLSRHLDYLFIISYPAVPPRTCLLS